MRYRLIPLALLSLLGLTCAPRGEPKKADFDPPKIGTPLLTDGLILEKRINAAIENVERRDLLTTHAFWTIFHGILGMGPDIPLLDPETGKRVKAIDQIANGDKIRGLEFIETPHGLDVVTMAGSGVGQGHQDQFVAEMTQWDMPLDQPILINGKKHRFEEFVRHSKMRTSVTRSQELGWAIVIISRHYGTNHRWTNMFGEELSLEDAIRYELKLPIPPAACGGTHRLFGLTWAYHLHLQAGGKTEGVWREVAEKLTEQIDNAKKFQNKDGSFSSEYVSGPGFTNNIDRRINTTGHVLEWLALALTDQELRQRWVEDAAAALTTMILNNKQEAIDGGSLYHAMHGLYIHRQRVYGTAGPRGLMVPLPPKK